MTSADTVTFLLTDIEGSTRLLVRVGDRYAAIMEAHRAIIADLARRYRGSTRPGEGDACLAVFSSAADAVRAAIDIQRALARHDWRGESVRVRIGIHTGRAVRHDDEYFGIDLHRAARIADAGHGGQVLVSGRTSALLGELVDEGIRLRDLGLHRLRDLDDPVRLWQVEADDLSGDFPPLRTLRPDTHNLPAQATSLVGRDDDVAAVGAMVRQHRLVTLTGPGGVGKTRLALHVAAAVVDGFADGAWLVELTRAHDATSVPAVIATTLGVETGGATDPVAVIAEALHDRAMLLVLDNFEHVVDAAGAVQTVLSAASGVHVLATSRERMLLSSEYVRPVGPLAVRRDALPTTRASDAVRLFVERARAQDPQFAPDHAALADIAAICAMTDGLPLAIELVAAQTRVLPVRAIRDRMRRGLDAVATTQRDRPARHRTLRNTIAWSYRLLTRDEQRLFARLSVFHGGRTLTAVAAVCMDGLAVDVVTGITALADKSLLRRHIGPDGDVTFEMLTSIHRFATEMLEASDDKDAVRRRHATWITALAERGDDAMLGHDAHTWEGVLNEHLGNIRAALTWTLGGGDTRVGIRLAAALNLFWYWGGFHHDLRPWMQRAMRHADVDAGTRGRLHTGLGFGGFADGDPAMSRRHWSAALAAFRAAGDRSRTSQALSLVALSYVGERDQADHALALIEEAQALAVADDPGSRVVADVLTCKGEIARLRGDDTVAGACYREALDIVRPQRNERYVARLQANLAFIAVHQGRHDTALHLLREALQTSWKLGERVFVAWTLSELAAPELGLGRPERAARLVGAAERALARFGVARQPADQLEHERTLVRLRSALGEQNLDDLLARGADLSLDEAVDLALRSRTDEHV